MSEKNDILVQVDHLKKYFPVKGVHGPGVQAVEDVLQHGGEPGDGPVELDQRPAHRGGQRRQHGQGRHNGPGLHGVSLLSMDTKGVLSWGAAGTLSRT